MRMPMFLPFVFSLLMACASKQPLLQDEATPPSVNKDRLLQLVNDTRKKGCQCGDTWYGPVPAISWNETLEKVALVHSEDMAKNKSLSHTSSAGQGPGERIRKAGYDWKSYGENIAYGFGDEKSVVEGWLSSPGHCRNIMDGDYREMGVARSGAYWTQDFGSR